MVSFIEPDIYGINSLKKSSFKEILLADYQNDPKIELPEEIVIETSNIQTTDTTVKSLLLFGDSMTILIGNRMAYYGAKNGYEVTSVTWYSSSTQIWGRNDSVSFFIDKYKPDFIMITLGSNELFIKNFEKREVYINHILEQIGEIPYVWIGPPNWKKDSGINDFLEKKLPAGAFFRTEGMELARGSDKIHPTQKAADQWTDSIMRWIEHSRHPILNVFPDSITKPAHTKKLIAPATY